MASCLLILQSHVEIGSVEISAVSGVSSFDMLRKLISLVVFGKPVKRFLSRIFSS